VFSHFFNSAIIFGVITAVSYFGETDISYAAYVDINGSEKRLVDLGANVLSSRTVEAAAAAFVEDEFEGLLLGYIEANGLPNQNLSAQSAAHYGFVFCGSETTVFSDLFNSANISGVITAVSHFGETDISYEAHVNINGGEKRLVSLNTGVLSSRTDEAAAAAFMEDEFEALLVSYLETTKRIGNRGMVGGVGFENWHESLTHTLKTTPKTEYCELFQTALVSGELLAVSDYGEYLWYFEAYADIAGAEMIISKNVEGHVISSKLNDSAINEEITKMAVFQNPNTSLNINAGIHGTFTLIHSEIERLEILNIIRQNDHSAFVDVLMDLNRMGIRSTLQVTVLVGGSAYGFFLSHGQTVTARISSIQITDGLVRNPVAASGSYRVTNTDPWRGSVPRNFELNERGDTSIVLTYDRAGSTAANVQLLLGGHRITMAGNMNVTNISHGIITGTFSNGRFTARDNNRDFDVDADMSLTINLFNGTATGVVNMSRDNGISMPGTFRNTAELDMTFTPRR
jgi:hypothetical protein